MPLPTDPISGYIPTPTPVSPLPTSDIGGIVGGYHIRPLPTLNPNTMNASEGMKSITAIFQRIIDMLKSVPVVPNAQGLFDSEGNWLTPVISAYDVLMGFLVIIATYVVLSAVVPRGVGFLAHSGHFMKDG